MVNTKIEIAGVKYHLGLGFINEMISGTGKQLNELAVLDNVILLPILMFYSRLYACKRNNEPVDFNQDDIFDYIDENGGIDGKIVVDFFTAYLQAMTKDVPIDDKKKVKVLKK